MKMYDFQIYFALLKTTLQQALSEKTNLNALELP